MIDPYDDDGFEREDIFTRKAAREDRLREEVKDSLIVALFGLAMTGMGVAGGWLVVVSLQRGYVDEGDRLVYLAEAPGDFWVSLGFVIALALGCGVLGVQMLLHARRERRRTSRLAERLRRVGRGAH